jgi:hypothetical protein
VSVIAGGKRALCQRMRIDEIELIGGHRSAHVAYAAATPQAATATTTAATLRDVKPRPDLLTLPD